ncbi:hypothetical protein BDF20DRAFT_873406 [Mycotypha africana]|uniref:uncharacterized protein n=1 Tax=Mycotypha africana TaxID=64632 RepID=UPI00230042F9|nr:uncharacterized protein BDF20DRAFT_873406 [Mycotypha africana]KAI8977179.1 hypothetical protein BDF20DRAFT_873406 [Mycotypha africana]
MKAGFLSFIVALCANIGFTQAFYGPKDNVKNLTPTNFRSEVMNTNHLVAVEFYAPWCGHCQRLAPEWKKAAKNLKGLVSVAAINCDEDANKGLCSQYGIQGFPTIKVFSPELKKDRRTGQISKVPTDYQGPRDARSIVDHLLSYQPSQVLFVKWNEKDVKSKKAITLEKFFETKNQTLPKVLLFTDKPTTTPLYKALSVDFKDRMLVGEVKHSEKNIIDEFEVQSFPTLLVFSPEHGAIKFEGKLNRDNLKTFMEKYALSAKDKKDNSSDESSGSKHNQSKKESKKVTAINTTEQLKKHCLDNKNSKAICVIALVSDDDKEDTLTTLNNLKDKVEEEDGVELTYGWIHASQSKGIKESLQLSEDYPSLFILHPSKQLFRNYIGSWNDDNLLKWLNQVASWKLQAWPYSSDLKLTTANTENNGEAGHDEL